VSELFVHPIKGCRPTAVGQVEVNEFGIKGDREFMVVRGGEKVNQKELPALAKICVEQFSPGHIRLTSEGVASIEHRRMTTGANSTVTFILDKVEVQDQGDDIADWISVIVGETVRLVVATDTFKRNLPIDPLKLAHDIPQEGFKDVSPVMIVNESTLEVLNSKLPEAVPVERFRPNVVVSGLEAYAEDELNQLAHEQFEFNYVSPCERCVIVNQDHESGETHGNDPLKTLSNYRRIEDKYDSGIVFGSYFNVRGDGLVKIGDELVFS
jgi:uncharacterized protein